MAADSAQSCTADFTAALIRRDMDAALSLLTDDVVFFYSNGSLIVGKPAFASLMTVNWRVVSDYEYSTLDSLWITQTPAAASVIYSFAWSGTASGNKVSGSGRGTRVLTGDASGWRIAHEHLSTGQWMDGSAGVERQS
jgi:ketosteroid isomerase-like protein